MSARLTFLLGTGASLVALYAWPRSRKVLFNGNASVGEKLAVGAAGTAFILGGYGVASAIDRKDAAPSPTPTTPGPLADPGPLLQIVGGSGFPTRALPIGQPIMLDEGHTYAAAVELPWYAVGVTKAKVQSYAEGKGFRDVLVFEKGEGLPAWPTRNPSPKADYFVIATYAGAPQTMDRPDAIIEAYA